MLKCGADRVCSHFFHEHCARQLPSQHCPMCRAEFTALERLPLLSEDAEGWFRCVALGRGELKKNQVRRPRLRLSLGPSSGPSLSPTPTPTPTPTQTRPRACALRQVMEALVTQFPLDVERFEEALEQLWPRWDHDQDGATPRPHTVVRIPPALPGQHGPLTGCSWHGASAAVTWHVPEEAAWAPS